MMMKAKPLPTITQEHFATSMNTTVVARLSLEERPPMN